ncbi:MAG: aminopeptidase, partial [Gemmatimonadetes bacterium]|nr:aminopeptidase [Gemmatimonadota bacterium]
AGTDIRFRIGDRPVNRQDGDASAARARQGRVLVDWHVELPAGALRVAPLETTVQGTIAYPRSRWSGEVVEDLTLTFVDGVVTDIAAAAGQSAVEAELAAAGEAAAFRELGVGFNPFLAVPDEDPWLPYFGYGSGVVRLSLGDNSELGGAVGGGYVRWVFFLDATVEIDGARWVEEGRLVDPPRASSPDVP